MRVRRALSAYVHFPWCLAKCPYCDFLSVATERPQLPHAAYADQLLRELERRAPELAGRELASIFFGGGTPSLWDPRELGRVLAALRGAFPSRGELEVTVECNPSSFDQVRATELLAAGANRVSIGVQSLDEGRLRFLGRLHDVDGGLQAVRDALRAGVPRVSADLIFGVHGQRVEDAVREALAIAEVGVTHQSVYALTIEPGTQFGALAKKQRLPLATEDTVANSFIALDEALSASGYEHYEISNYAREAHVSEHNLGYWRGHDYLGLGCGAWGTLTSAAGRVRYRNTPSPERYLATDFSTAALDAVAPGGALGDFERIDPEMALVERLMLGLRVAEGVDVEALGDELGVPVLTPERERRVARLVERGRLRREGTRLVIPRGAWLHADGTIAGLV